MDIRIVLEDEMEKYFETIKSFYNLKSNTELIRLMTIRFYNYVVQQKKEGKDQIPL